MQQMFLKVLPIALALLMSAAANGQSLGDVARENRQKKDADAASAAQPKVITNADLPKDQNENQGPSDAQPAAGAANSNKAADRRLPDHRLADHRSAQQRLAEQRAAEQWKKQILAQKNKVALLQARLDSINASIQSAGGSAESDRPYSPRQTQRGAQVQLQLDAEKRKLDQMQEAARHAGMDSAVYDP
jgi:hypothetical protein